MMILDEPQSQPSWYPNLSSNSPNLYIPNPSHSEPCV